MEADAKTPRHKTDAYRQYMREWRAKNKDRIAQWRREYVAANRDRCNERGREWKRANPDKAKAAAARFRERHPGYFTRASRERSLRQYGISEEDYTAMLATQGGVCAICGTGDPGGHWKAKFMVDHCHDSGAVRGLLCNPCNLSLARVETAGVAKFAAYLARRP